MTVVELKEFAKRVNAVARRMLRTHTGGTFGDDKVFTHAAWAAGRFDMSLPAFKEELLTAHRARLLTLSRADLVEAMDPYDVSRSLIRYGNAEFNFIRVTHSKKSSRARPKSWRATARSYARSRR